MLTPVPPTDCMRARESASAQLDGELPELELARLDAHLQECWECSAWADAIRGTAEQLRGAGLERPSIAIELPSRAALRIRRTLVLAGTAAAIAAGAVVGLRGAPSSKQVPEAASRVVVLAPAQQDVRDAHILALSRRLTGQKAPHNGDMFAA